MFGKRARTWVLLALSVAVVLASSAGATGIQTDDSPTGFVISLVDFLVHVVF